MIENSILIFFMFSTPIHPFFLGTPAHSVWMPRFPLKGGGMCRREGGRTVPAIVVTHRFGSVSLSRYFELGVFGVGVLLALASAVLAAAVAALVY